MMTEQSHGENSGKCGPAQNYRRSPCRAPTATARQHHGTHGEALGNLVQKNRQKDQPSQPVRHQKARGNGDAVEEGMNDESEQHGISLLGMHELVVMCFLAEMKMRSDRMFKKMNN